MCGRDGPAWKDVARQSPAFAFSHSLHDFCTGVPDTSSRPEPHIPYWRLMRLRGRKQQHGAALAAPGAAALSRTRTMLRRRPAPVCRAEAARSTSKSGLERPVERLHEGGDVQPHPHSKARHRGRLQGGGRSSRARVLRAGPPIPRPPRPHRRAGCPPGPAAARARWPGRRRGHRERDQDGQRRGEREQGVEGHRGRLGQEPVLVGPAQCATQDLAPAAHRDG